MKKNFTQISIIGMMVLLNSHAIAQVDVLNHVRVSGYYVGWDGVGGTSGSLEVKNNFNSDINFSTNSTQRATILANGNMGIGTATSGQKLTVSVGEINCAFLPTVIFRF